MQDDVIVTAPFQKYYIQDSCSWLDADNINIDTKLCSLSNQAVDIQAIAELHQEVELFDIHLEDVHTFCVTTQDIVVHNFPPFFIGISFAFGGGVTFEGIKAGLCIAGLWFGTKILKKKKYTNDSELTVSCDACLSNEDDMGYNLKDESQDAQAPGKPTEKDGFIPKKNWDGKKVKHPITGQVGWPDKKGNIWRPTGPGSLAHGGPHWDVVSKDGKQHWNIMPGGKERGSK